MKKIAFMLCAALALFTACEQRNDKFRSNVWSNKERFSKYGNKRKP